VSGRHSIGCAQPGGVELGHVRNDLRQDSVAVDQIADLGQPSGVIQGRCGLGSCMSTPRPPAPTSTSRPGGSKASGYGPHEQGRAAIEFYTEEITIYQDV
jgi:hypothetical protein